MMGRRVENERQVKTVNGKEKQVSEQKCPRTAKILLNIHTIMCSFA